jgi:hypothetical protein
MGRIKAAGGRLVRRGPGNELDELTARRQLDERCAALADRL